MSESFDKIVNLPNGTEKPTKEQAVFIIGELIQQVNIMGANDFEIPTLNTLLESLNAGECTPEEAIEIAHNIRNRKADYH